MNRSKDDVDCPSMTSKPGLCAPWYEHIVMIALAGSIGRTMIKRQQGLMHILGPSYDVATLTARPLILLWLQIGWCATRCKRVFFMSNEITTRQDPASILSLVLRQGSSVLVAAWRVPTVHYYPRFCSDNRRHDVIGALQYGSHALKPPPHRSSCHNVALLYFLVLFFY